MTGLTNAADHTKNSLARKKSQRNGLCQQTFITWMFPRFHNECLNPQAFASLSDNTECYTKYFLLSPSRDQGVWTWWLPSFDINIWHFITFLIPDNSLSKTRQTQQAKTCTEPNFVHWKFLEGQKFKMSLTSTVFRTSRFEWPVPHHKLSWHPAWLHQTSPCSFFSSILFSVCCSQG